MAHNDVATDAELCSFIMLDQELSSGASRAASVPLWFGVLPVAQRKKEIFGFYGIILAPAFSAILHISYHFQHLFASAGMCGTRCLLLSMSQMPGLLETLVVCKKTYNFVLSFAAALPEEACRVRAWF